MIRSSKTYPYALNRFMHLVLFTMLQKVERGHPLILIFLFFGYVTVFNAKTLNLM